MLYLASTSPRRRQLLAAAGIGFSEIEPGPEPTGFGSPLELAELRARSKATGAESPGGTGWILGVDTVVDLAGQELGKPRDEAQAQGYLARLAGTEHQVHTALCLVAADGSQEIGEVVTARVRFQSLSAADIRAFLATGAWRGKAGGYGIQDPECGFAELLEGDLETVIGLPTAVVRALLQRVGA